MYANVQERNHLPCTLMYMNDSAMTRDQLVEFLREVLGKRNGVHLRDLLPQLSEVGLNFFDPADLRAHLERNGIAVRTQLKVAGLNAAGIHWSALKGTTGADVRVRPPRPSVRGHCIAKDDDGLCGDSASVTVPVTLCEFHRWDVAVRLVPELAGQMPTRLSVDELVDGARPVEPPQAGSHERLVYFLTLGSRVKIGYTSHLAYRLTSLCLPRSCVTLTVEGGRRVEAALHRRFAALHTEGEWFRLEPPLTDYITAKAAQPLP